MKKWQEERNYRRIRNEQGQIVANIITVDGVDVAASDEVYLAYSQADRRERYMTEEAEAGKVLSLDKLLEDHVPLESLGAEQAESAEESTIAKEEQETAEAQKVRLLLEKFIPAVRITTRTAERHPTHAITSQRGTSPLWERARMPLG